MGDRGGRMLAEIEKNPIAGFQSSRQEQIGEAMGEALDLAEAVAIDGPIGALMDEGERMGVLGMAIADIPGDIVTLRDLPAEGAIDLVVRSGAGDQHVLISIWVFPVPAGHSAAIFR